MNTIQTAYINALLADASYVEGIQPGEVRAADFTKRLTQSQADFLAANFTVLDSVETPRPLGSGFDAFVLEGKAGTPYAGQVYVSMRGTQGGTDIADDLALAGQGIPRDQIVSMVNWCLRLTTPKGSQARQIKWDPLHVNPANPTQVVPSFVDAPGVAGLGNLVGRSSIAGANGHSLGGYLATAFARLFGGALGYNVQSVSTFNSAGFNNLQGTQIESTYNQLAQLLGSSLGTGSFAAVAPKQTNLFGQNGIEFTTNSWADISIPGFNQYGERVALYQEDLLTGSVAPTSLWRHL